MGGNKYVLLYKREHVFKRHKFIESNGAQMRLEYEQNNKPRTKSENEYMKMNNPKQSKT